VARDADTRSASGLAAQLLLRRLHTPRIPEIAAMSGIATIAAAMFKHAGKSQRVIVAVAGPPGAGKSTVVEELAAVLPAGSAAVVPMDGFHYDDAVLEALGLRKRKGAPETFDFDGYEALLRRLLAGDRDVAVPIFDRSIEISRAAAAIVPKDVKFVLTEGNYLLLDEEPWSRLAPLFDFTVFLDVPRDELERRLIQRWLDHGRTPEDGRRWVDSNDLPNVDRVLGRRGKADLTVTQAGQSS
jgi:pantothenate kinase